jgi:O-antigen ligase
VFEYELLRETECGYHSEVRALGAPWGSQCGSLPDTLPEIMQPAKPILIRTLLVVLPSAAALAAGQLDAACFYFYGMLAMVMAYDILLHRHLHVMATLLACTPMLILLRGHFFYSGPQVLYTLALVQAPLSDLNRLRKNRLVVWLNVAALVYWGATFAVTQNYASNFRALELTFSATLIYLLAQHRSIFRPAMIGFALCGIAVGAGLLPNGAMEVNGESVFRLGLTRVAGHSIGNPISFGTCIATAFLLTISMGGSWFGLGQRKKLLLAIQAMTAVWLVLSTSRGSWAVAFTGLVIIYWTEPRRRAILLAGLGLVLVAGAVLVSFSHDATLTSYVDKTFSSDTSMAKLTTGRSLQWASFPAAWSDAPIFGHGPGSSLEAGRKYFEENLIYHALLLQIGVETGSFGLILLFLFFLVLFDKAYRYYRTTGDPIALIGAAGYFVVGLSVPALDAASGCLLGLGLIGTDLSNFVRIPRAAAAHLRVPVILRTAARPRLVTGE